jgi:outer membrane protein OmpA-like peptidoglycan-associated protein
MIRVLTILFLACISNVCATGVNSDFVITFAGKKDKETITKEQLLNNPEVNAFSKTGKFTIRGFHITVFFGSLQSTESSSSEKVTPKQLALLKSVRPGNKIYIENIGVFGEDNTLRYASITLDLVSKADNLPSNINFTSISAKLLSGEKVKVPVENQVVNLQNERGEILQFTQTDLYGDFSFNNVDIGEKLTLAIPQDKNIPPDVPVFIANQNGVVIKELKRDKNSGFIYELLPADIKLLTLSEEDDPQLKIKNFKKSSDNELVIRENILYSSGKFDINNESKQTLNKIAISLKQNPNYHLEIYAHTDAIGEAKDNLVLSEKRAHVVKQYIVSRGVPQEKITAKGLGETQILNRCLDGVSCSETEHQYNRRTEFKLVKK